MLDYQKTSYNLPLIDGLFCCRTQRITPQTGFTQHSLPMTLEQFLAADGQHFVALEYYWLMLNRTFLVLLTKQELIGLKVGGVISVEGGRDALTRTLTASMAVKGDLQNPYSYVKSKYIDKYINMPLDSTEFLKMDSANFVIPYQEISEVSLDKTSKWGMGNYPHTGKVYVTTKSGKKTELIILGNQSIERIYQQLSQAVPSQS